MKNQRVRNIFITLFVILWTMVFHYESLRHFYLQPLFKRSLPKLMLLFPPAGWIMFYRQPDSDGFTEVYGVREGDVQRIDPHDIIQVRTIGYDNIHRNILSEIADARMKPKVCRYLQRKFHDFDAFVVTIVYYPSFSKTPHRKIQKVLYQCP